MSMLSFPIDVASLRNAVRAPAGVSTRIPLSVRLVKRAVDVVAAFIGLLATAALFPVLMAAIYADSPGPIFYRQRRVARVRGASSRGLDCVEFDMFKFRTMRVDAE